MQGFDREMGFLRVPSSSQQWTWNSIQSFLWIGDVAKGFWSCQGAVLCGPGSKASDAAWGHTLSRSRGLQVPETCNHSCTCYKEWKRKSVMFHHGQSQSHFTLMEGPRTWVEMELLHQMTNSGWKLNNRCWYLFLKTGFHFTGIMLFCQIKKRGVSLHKPLFWILVHGFKSMEAWSSHWRRNDEPGYQAWCYHMDHPNRSYHKNIQYWWGSEMCFRRWRDIEC